MTVRPRVTASPIHRSFLLWRNGLHGKTALLMTIFCVMLYAMQHPEGPPNGGTTLGYGFGILASCLVLWLAWFGMRRRRYGGTGSLDGLLSAHVYFGTALIVVAALHAGFRFHWNVHTLAFALLSLVVASGAFGTFAFWRYPGLMTRNRDGATLTTMAAQIAALDLECQQLALSFPDAILSMVQEAVAPNATAGVFGELLSRRRQVEARRRSHVAIAGVQATLTDPDASTPAEVLPLVQCLTQRLTLLERMCRDRRHRVMILQWRAIHVPLTIGLIVALSIHVIVVFYDR
jgi:hypothetical protein